MSPRCPALVLCLLLLTAVCGPPGAGSATGEELAADSQQTLSFPIAGDVYTLDPALMSSTAEINIGRNLFNGLYRIQDDLKEGPDLASRAPDISADGLTYTFTLRKDARFSNGSPVHTDDVIYSWDRAAALHGPYASVFEPVVGYEEVASGQTRTLKGLSKVDDVTLRVRLTRPAGYWYSELVLWPTWIVDRKSVDAGGDQWWAKPDSSTGTGPFKLSGRIPKISMDFTPVSGWWGGSSGPLQKVHVEVVDDAKHWIAKFEAGGYDVIGYGGQTPAADDLVRYSTDPQLRKQLSLAPVGRTIWVGFSFKTGPFTGIDAGRDGRRAFSMAVNRSELADAVCAHGTICAAATGGLIPRGLQGYLGDAQDPNAKFDPGTAKTIYERWDPDRKKLKDLTYTYPAGTQAQAIAENLQSQWRANLGVTVKLEALDRSTFARARATCSYPLFRNSWEADYDHPQHWLDNLVLSGGGSGGSCYNSSTVDRQITDSNRVRLSAAMPGYKQAEQLLIQDVQYSALLYGVQPYLIKPYLRGVGGTALFDLYWVDAGVLRH